MISCCRYCTPETGRQIGCHSYCQAYLEEKLKHVEENNTIVKNRYKNSLMLGYLAEDKEKRRKRY